MNSKLFNTNSDFHFGEAIKEFLESQPGGVHEAAKKLGYKVLSLYPIFRKADVNTALLRKLGEVYKTNPFISLNLYGNQEADVKLLQEEMPAYDQPELHSAMKIIAVLEAQKSGLEEQVKLLREMVDVLKERDK
jgi:hypothetical protein